MKNILFGVSAATICILLNSCVNPGPAPQDVRLKDPDGKSVIIKDIYELPLIENKKLKETEIVKIFFPQDDNVKISYSMTLLKIPAGISQAKYKQTSAQIIYAISGGGKLVIGSNMIVLKKGIMVYVPPNAPMAITNNVDKILEIIVVTSPPFEPSQMTILGEKTKKVKIAKDIEDEHNENDVDVQDVSDKYKTNGRRRTLSVDEYRDMMNKTLIPDEGNDSVVELLKESDKKNTEKNTWPLKMPDSSKTPLEQLEREQQNKLIPKTPQKLEHTNVQDVQELSPKEHSVPLREEKIESDETKSDEKKDYIDKLLENQKKSRELPVSGEKVKKTSLKSVQEISPDEHIGGVSKKDAAEKIKVDEDPLEKLLRDQKKQREKLIPKKPQQVKKTSLKHVQELSPEESSIKTKSDKTSEL